MGICGRLRDIQHSYDNTTMYWTLYNIVHSVTTAQS